MKQKKTITKQDLMLTLHNKIGYTKQFSKALVDDVFKNIKNKLLQGQGVKIYGFGKFILRDKSNRKGRNPQTGKAMTIKSRRVVTFRPSLILREKFKN